MIRGAAPRSLLYALFVLSGIAGLIYESIWSHYLKLFLGHAAYAQTLVLTIFMGGMAIGAWLAGSIARRAAQPLLWYAGIEALLGLAGFGFDPLFRGMQAWMFDAVIPQLGSPLSVDLAKWSVSTLIILPQSILLGATFPMMSAGIVRRHPDVSGSVLSWLYFTNSIGASAGVLLSGFVLIAAVGLPGTLLTAGLINFALALSVYLVARSDTAPAALRTQVTTAAATPRLILAAAFLTGAASFFYEIGWIRMLSLVIGSATHSFELMLSAFIFGLAAGAFWIRNRIDGQRDPLRLLGLIQVLMALSALLTLTLYMGLFETMATVRGALAANDTGYVLYSLLSSSLCYLLMLPATFCAGMTLPLMTAVLLRGGHGEGSIGRVYAANTLGAIAGILLAVHLVMPVLGLRQVVVTGALIDFALGVWLLRGAIVQWRWPQRGALAAAGLVSLAIIATVRFDPAVMASGPFYIGQSRISGEILFHADGKTATIDAYRAGGDIVIATNGKIDAGVPEEGRTGPDDYTMGLLSLMPSSMLPRARTAAVIGMGSGMSTHVLLHNPRIERVDTIEIEPAMVEGARAFGKLSSKTYDDPRSVIHIEDAKTYFARSGQRYDLIISEPSNPWVSGVASLFSTDFYAQARRHLNDDGLFVQWLHLYQNTPELIATIVNALGASFDDYAIYSSNGGDLLILSRPRGPLPAFDSWIFAEPALQPPLQRIGMRSAADFEMRRLGGKHTLAPLFAQLNPRANSDYQPILDLGALRERYKNSDAAELLEIHPYSQRLEKRRALLAGASVSRPQSADMPLPLKDLRAQALAKYFLDGELDAGLVGVTASTGVVALGIAGPCATGTAATVVDYSMKLFVVETARYLQPATGARVVDKFRRSPCYAQMGASVHNWVSLIEAITQQRPAQVRDTVLKLLPQQLDDLPAAQFLVAELLLADLQMSDAQGALKHLDAMHGLPHNLVIRYLDAYALAQAMDQQRPG